MEQLTQSNIFFFISSIGFIIIFSLLAILIIRVIKLLKMAKDMAKRLEGNVETIGEEAKNFFADLRTSFVYRLMFGRKRK